jgi:hypothetical protein
MILYALGTAIFFSLLWKTGLRTDGTAFERREQVRFFLLVFCGLFFGGLALGWLMFPFPLK